MKKALSLILALLMVLSLAACASNQTAAEPAKEEAKTETSTETKTEAPAAEASAAEEMKIGFAMYNVSEFTVLMRDGIQAECDERGAKLITLEAGYDAATQLDQVENLITQGCDAIVLAPVDADALVPAVDMCEEAGVPLSVVNCALNTDKPYYYVGPDDVQAGEVETQYMMDTLGGKGNVLVFQCKIGTSYEIQRTEGIQNVLAKYPDVTVLAIDSANGNRDEGVDLMENWFETYGDQIDGIISQNDGMAMGIIQVLQANGKSDIPVIGVDAIEDALVAIDKGELLGTVYQDADLEGRNAVKLAFDLIDGNPPAQYINMIDMTLVTKDNAAELLKTVYGK